MAKDVCVSTIPRQDGRRLYGGLAQRTPRLLVRPSGSLLFRAEESRKAAAFPNAPPRMTRVDVAVVAKYAQFEQGETYGA
jgi:hypothetical protein